MDRYRSHPDQRINAYATQCAQDPKFSDYKARERSSWKQSWRSGES
jgi:hypothetical protein